MEKRQPKYVELVNWIREQIDGKKFLPGQRMYSENRLKEMFHVSRQTIRHAIGILEEEGVLVRKRGSGTYVSDIRQENLENKTGIAVVTTYVDGYIFPKTIQGIEEVLFERVIPSKLLLPTTGLAGKKRFWRSEEHTSELQSPS